jgi:hypothetical protein
MSIPAYPPRQSPVYLPDEKVVPSFNPAGTFAPQPGVRMPQEQLYFRGSFPPQAAVVPPWGATMPKTGPHPSDIQMDSATTHYRAGGVPEPSRSPIMSIDNQQRELQFPMTALPQTITTQQRLSKIPSGYFGAPEPSDDVPFNMYPSSPLNPATNFMTTMQQASYLTPQSEDASKSSPSPCMDEQVPALTTQPQFDWKDNACIVSHDPLLNNNGEL